jgi:eukaryotic-like serine/threonine-protein kinase
VASTRGPDDPIEPGTVIAGRYSVLDVIAEGALSVVYRVEHVHTGERLAMKMFRGRARLDPQALPRFKQEARTASRLRSDHVVLVTDAGTAPELGGSPFMIMELREGNDQPRCRRRWVCLPSGTRLRASRRR